MKTRRKRKRNIVKTVLMTLLVIVSVSVSFFCGYKYGTRQSINVPNIDELAEKAEINNTVEHSDMNLDQKYIAVVEEHVSKIDGIVQYGIHKYNDDTVYFSDTKRTPSASIIKLFIMEYAYEQIEIGNLSNESVINGESLDNLINKMITVSDNMAANKLIDYFGMDKMNDFFKLKGYGDTLLERKMLDNEAVKNGKNNYTSIKDVMSFLDKVYEGKDRFPYSEMLDVMKKQKIDTKIRKKFPSDVIIANKTGELSDVENDVGIIFGEKCDFAIAFLTQDVTNSTVARNSISEAAYELYNLLQADM